MKTTTLGAYPKPSYLKIPDWFQNIDNTPIDWGDRDSESKRRYSYKTRIYFNFLPGQRNGK